MRHAAADTATRQQDVSAKPPQALQAEVEAARDLDAMEERVMAETLEFEAVGPREVTAEEIAEETEGRKGSSNQIIMYIQGCSHYTPFSVILP